MVSTRTVAGGLLRAVVFTPLILLFAAFTMRTKATAMALLSGSPDLGALLGVVWSLPYAPLLIVLTAAIAFVNPGPFRQ